MRPKPGEGFFQDADVAALEIEKLAMAEVKARPHNLQLTRRNYGWFFPF